MDKKYMFLNSSLTGGGSERVMSIIASYLADMGHDTSMLLLREKEERSYKISNNLRCHQLYYGTNNKIIILIKRFIQVRKYIKEINPDVIISFMWDINLFTILAAIGLNKKIIISERNCPSMQQNPLKKFGEKYIYPLADKIVFQTEDVKKYYRDSVQKKGVVIPNPVNNELPNNLNISREKKIIALGRLTEQKNFPMLIRAFKKFNRKYPEYTLDIYGQGELENDLKDLVINLGLSESVNFHGYINDLYNKICSASIYVSSSNFEGISNSMIEALAMGVPSICTDCPVGGAAMMIQDGINGLLIPVGDENALYAAMCKIASDESFSRKLSNEAIKIRENYSVEKIYRKWMDIL